MCYTAYVFVNNQSVMSFTDSKYKDVETRAEKYVKKNNLDAEIYIEDTSDKFEDLE